MPNPIKYEPGQTIYIENRYSTSNKLREVKVTSVGRKWIHLSDGSKIAIGTNLASAWNGNEERVYASKEEYEERKLLCAAWTGFRKFIERNWEVPDHVKLRDIQYAMKLLTQKEE